MKLPTTLGVKPKLGLRKPALTCSCPLPPPVTPPDPGFRSGSTCRPAFWSRLFLVFFNFKTMDIWGPENSLLGGGGLSCTLWDS